MVAGFSTKQKAEKISQPFSTRFPPKVIHQCTSPRLDALDVKSYSRGRANPPFMDQDIISRLRTRLSAEGLDAVIAISPENVTYVSGFVVPSQSLMRWRHAICIVTADGKISMVAIDMEAATVK